MNEVALVDLLKQKLGNDVVIHNNPDKDSQLLLNKNKIKSYFKEYTDTKEHTKLSTFVIWLKSKNTTENTKGIYHKYMPFVHAYDNITTNNRGIPSILPSRDEYLVMYALDYLLGKSQLKDIYTIDNQFRLENKYFDGVISKLNILIEVQEDKSNHDDKNSDNIKRLLAKYNKYCVLYFKLNDLKKDESSIVKFFNTELLPAMYGAISIYQKEYIYSVVRFMYIDKQKYYLKLEESKKTSTTRILFLKDQIKSFESCIEFEKIMKMYINKNNSNSEFIFTFDDFSDILQSVSITSDKLENSKYISKIMKDTTYYYSWSALNYIILNYTNAEIKNTMMCFLTELDMIYKEYIEMITTYTTNTTLTKSEIEHLNDHLNGNMIDYLQKENSKLKKNSKILVDMCSIYYKKFNIGNIKNAIKSIRDSPFKKVSVNVLEKLKTPLDTICNFMEQLDTIPKYTIFTPQKIIGKSIIKQIDDFPYVYDDNSSGVELSELILACKERFIDDETIDTIMKSFTALYDKNKTIIIPDISYSISYSISGSITGNIIESESKLDEENSINSDTSSESESKIEENEDF